MESMRSLDRSLPGSQEPSEELNSAFKAAAISTTTLYKKAILGQRLARQSGYQDALDDLLSFLDRRNLGLQDGEGWLVRQWATKLLDDRPTTTSNLTHKDDQHVSDSEEEKEVEKDKSPTPPSREESSPVLHPREIQTEPEKPAAAAAVSDTTILNVPTAAAFTFQSAHVYPKDVEMQVIESTSKREVSPRTTRQRKLGKQRTSAGKSGGGGGGGGSGNGGGSKRKLPFGEFFDISDLTGDSNNNNNNNSNNQDGRRPTTRRKLG